MPTSLTRISDDWVKAALANRALFGDGPPQWDNLPSRQDAMEERDARVRLFRKHNDVPTANTLSCCTTRCPCASGACPVCTRALQRHFVFEALSLLRPSHDFVTVSLVPNARIPHGNLARLRIITVTDEVAKRLLRSKIDFCVGGVDFSYNESHRSDFSSHWSPHIWFLTNKLNRARWEPRLRKHFRRSSTTPRPIKIQEWDGDKAAIGYALKYKFNRRISKLGMRSPNNRVCKVTTYDKLRSAERFELYSYLHTNGLGSRILLMDVDADHIPHLTLADESD